MTQDRGMRQLPNRCGFALCRVPRCPRLKHRAADSLANVAWKYKPSRPPVCRLLSYARDEPRSPACGARLTASDRGGTQMTAATTTRSDAEIQRDVQEELKWEARVQPNEVGVIVKGGVVTLTGWVDSFIKKWSAERAALRVDGVHAVANDIEVRLNPADERTDGDVASAATRALQWDAVVPDDK